MPAYLPPPHTGSGAPHIPSLAINGASAVAPVGRPRLFRARDGRLLGGVSAGIATHVGVPTWVVRTVFVAGVPFQGVSVLLYAVFWVVLRSPVDSDDAASRQAHSWQRSDVGQALLFGVIVAVTVAGLGLWQSSTQILIFSCIGIVIVGAALTWQRSDATQRDRSDRAALTPPWLAGPGTWRLMLRPVMLLRWVCGGGLVLTGLAGLLIVSGELTALRSGLIFTVAMLVGIAVVAGPWLARVLDSLRQERYERIRSQERAEVAAIVHDKVMHTLALIRRRATDSREVSRLARGQERELRNWLYKPTAAPDQQLSAALESVAAEVEDAYAVTVDVVVVGDATLDESLAALVAAAREALLNAAKHAGVADISLYAEVETVIARPMVSVFVRDRGSGFALEAIPPDRHGVHDSIVARMSRHAGHAQLRTAPGEGTEVRLQMPLPSGQLQGGAHVQPTPR